MNQAFKRNKGIVREFLRTEYSTEKLLQIIDGARSDTFAFYSCCCLVGFPTANHEMKPARENTSDTYWWGGEIHYTTASRKWPLTEVAIRDISAFGLGFGKRQKVDAKFRRLILPMAKAELARRNPNIVRMTEEMEFAHV